jgi:peptide/nickel transport system substrate-binding protein
LAAIDEVTVVDPNTVRIHTSYPYAPLLNMLSYFVYIAPKHLLEGNFLDNDDFNLKHPIGSGPFKVVEVGDGFIRYEAFEDYYKGRPYIDEIIVTIIEDPETQVAQLIAGEMDLHEVAPGRHMAVLEQQDHLKLVTSPTTKYNHCMINHDDPILGDRLVRLALIYALDRQKMIDSVMMGRGDMAIAPIPKSVGWAFADDLEPIPYDPKKAKELLEEAGFVMGEKFWEKDGEPFSFTISVDNVATDRRENAVIAQQYWRDIGIDAKLEIMDWTTWLYERFRGVPEVTNGYWAHPTDPDLSGYWTCEGSMNVPYSRYCNEEVDRLFAEGAQAMDREERAAIYHQIQEIMLQDPPVIIFYYLTETNAMVKNLMGLPNLEMRDSLEWANEWYFEQ